MCFNFFQKHLSGEKQTDQNRPSVEFRVLVGTICILGGGVLSPGDMHLVCPLNNSFHVQPSTVST